MKLKGWHKDNPKVMARQPMRRNHRIGALRALLTILYLFVPCAMTLADEPIPADALKAIDAANGEWVSALETRNVQRACQGFADDALFIADDGKITAGVDAFEAALQKRFDAGLKITGGKVTRLGAHLVNGQIIEWGRSVLNTVDKNGVAHKGGGDYLAVWSRGKDGAWKIVRNISLGPDQS